jgi:hypothetical protein
MSSTFVIRHDSLEYLPVRVTGFRAGEVYNPTTDTVKVALPVTDIEPVTDDWNDATWETVDDDYFARLLVGPGGAVTLVAGDYDILVKVGATPEIPVLRAGLLRVT